MPDKIPEKNLLLNVAKETDHKRLCKVCHALSVEARVQIMKLLLCQNKSLSDIASELDMPISSVARHIAILLDAQMIFIHYQPGLKGHAKYCSQALLNIQISMNSQNIDDAIEPASTVEMPIGMFSHCHITQPCGMLGKEGPIGEFDDPRIFFTPDRIKTECLWFNVGSVSYNFPTTSLFHRKCSELSFTFEICSEAVYFNNNWPSDITLSINKTEVVTFTSPGDFGGRRGKFTPKYWPVTSTQFGILKNLTINKHGVFLDNTFITSSISFESLNLREGNSIQFTIEVKEDAKHRGGLNLFGKNFGDFPQAIIMTVH